MRFFLIFTNLVKYMALEKLLYLLREAVFDCVGARFCGLWIPTRRSFLEMGMTLMIFLNERKCRMMVEEERFLRE